MTETQQAYGEWNEQALKAYDNDLTVKLDNDKTRPKTNEERHALWLELWKACDFSWDGLADAGWAHGHNTNYAQKLKSWKAPASLPIDGPIYGKVENRWKPASLQDYWRYTQLPDGSWRDEIDTFKSLGLLTEENGVVQFCVFNENFVLSSSGESAASSAFLTEIILERLQAASGYNSAGFDGRCQFAGVRAKNFDKIWQGFYALAPEDSDNLIHLSMPLAELESINATRLQFGDKACFQRTAFGNKASFSGAKFGDNANLHDVTFAELARFSEATFGDKASFDRATFGDEARFNTTTFGDKVSFSDTVFGNNTKFGTATFAGLASFHRATFGDKASFSRAAFADRINFRVCDFKGSVLFSNINWETSVHYDGGFRGAKFREVADFRASNFSNFSIFDGADFQRKLLLSEPSKGETPESLFKRAVKSAEDAVEIAWPNERELANTRRAKLWQRVWPFWDKKREAKNTIYGELAGGYRTAKKVMEDESNFERAQRYYRFEVQARIKKASVKWPERWAAGFYALFSAYGASIGRPFAALAGFILVFAVIYLGLAVGSEHSKLHAPRFGSDITFIANSSHESTWQALEFSMNNAFRPLSALATEAPREEQKSQNGDRNLSVSEHLLFNQNGLVRFLVKLLAIFQSFLSILLAFLFGLAIRRKFQIS